MMINYDNNSELSRPIKDIPYGEESGQYRRTVYSHDDWKKHRSADRFLYYLGALFNSGVYKNLGRRVTATTSVAAFLCLWNALTGEYQDLERVKHAGVLSTYLLPVLGMPLVPFTLASPSLGLLLGKFYALWRLCVEYTFRSCCSNLSQFLPIIISVFRTNTSYQRWDEARKNWGMNINHARDLVRMANAYYDSTGVSPEERQQDLRNVALCTWAFVRAMKRHLSPEEEDEEVFRTELFEKLPPLQAKMIIDAVHRPNRALQDLSYAIDNLPMHFLRKNEIQHAVTIFEDDLGSSERLLTSPVPLFYSRHTARFLTVWLLLLPFALYDAFASSWNHIALIPAITILSVFLFGIEELATQLEEPFSILPMQTFCDKIYSGCIEIMTWSPGDNGMRVRPVRPEHAYFVGAVMPPTPTPKPIYLDP
jgi:predicted membrane chloride channel (bestrophin family)